MKSKVALIFGVTGQDGSYLSELLLKNKYKVHGVKRRSSLINTKRVDHLFYDNKNFQLHYGDVTDTLSIINLIKKIKPDEIYNLAAQSHVAVSFDIPIYTANANAIGTLVILDAIYKTDKKIRFYQAGSSEMFGESIEKKEESVESGAIRCFLSRSGHGIVTKSFRDVHRFARSRAFRCASHVCPLQAESQSHNTVPTCQCVRSHSQGTSHSTLCVTLHCVNLTAYCRCGRNALRFHSGDSASSGVLTLKAHT